MKTLKSTDLPGLPQQVRGLVADGVYSLYELGTEMPKYILITAKGAEYYFLSSSGEPVAAPTNVHSLKDVALGSPVTFPAQSDSPRLNVG